ncbi:MAG: SUMF1/EgtB/PvdO family nonheme iron enzyme [Caldilineaceae bacterium]|nr:SUMF1/EgtB/PvdO family nonheme iron enzyme [Caldilineaceae bacterium]
MDLTWLTQLPKPTQDLLVGGVANLAGNLATQAVSALLAAASRPRQKRLQQAEIHSALEAAMAQALAATVAELTHDPDEARHFLTLLGDWLQREAVADELYRLVEPSPDSAPDLALLEVEFVAAGWSAEHLGAGRSFGGLIAALAQHFGNAAAQQPALQGPMEIGLLRGLAARLDHLARTGEEQAQALRQVTALLERFAPLDMNQVERAYLRGLYAQCNDLPLARDERADPSGGPRLQRVYVELQTDQPPTLDQLCQRLGLTSAAQRRRAESVIIRSLPDGERRSPAPAAAQSEWVAHLRRLEGDARGKLAQALGVEAAQLEAALVNLAPVEALREAAQMVLLGDPGSGKSTLTQRLAALLAAAGCDDPQLYADLGDDEVTQMEQLLQRFGRRLLPVRILLNRWAQQLPAEGNGVAGALIDACVRVLRHAAPLDDGQKQHFVARLTADPPTVLILLDGLDEVSDEGRRKQMLDAIRDFHHHYPATPLLVTCRVRPYRAWRQAGQTLPLPDFSLAPLSPPAVERFIERWYAELVHAEFYDAEQANQKQHDLRNALADPRRAELREMAGTPLLLTMMARVNYLHGLPHSRAELYERFVGQLLYEWERRKREGPGQAATLDQLLAEAGIAAGSLDLALNRLAHSLHGQAHNNDTVDIPAWRLRGALEGIHPGDPGAKAAWAVQVLNLIADRSGLIYLVDGPTVAAAQANEGAGEGIYKFSHRTFQEYLAARHLAGGDSQTKFANFQACIDREGWREAFLLGVGYLTYVTPQFDDVLALLDELMPATGAAEADRRRILLLGEAYVRLLGPQRAQEAAQRQRAQRVMETVPQRLEALMQARDAPAAMRLEAGLLLGELGFAPPGLDDFVSVNTAPALGYRLRVGRYPVTNAQFRRFMAADGYAPENETRWWSEKGIGYKHRYEWREPRYERNPRFNQPTQPVVGVSWYEAQAYCAWLTEGGRRMGAVGEDEEVRLPTQAEWEAVARSRHSRDYPWGSDEFDPARANTKESGLGQTTPVHLYADGRTPEGVWDLSGNVWEWTSDLRQVDKDGDEWFYLKGGSWFFDAKQATASAAIGNDAWGSWGYELGFRVVVVPISRG